MEQHKLSIVHGPKTPALYEGTVADLIRQQTRNHGGRTAVSVPWQHARFTYADLDRRSAAVASFLVESRIQTGDMIAIMAGNRYEYIETFLGAARIGVTVAVLNITYTPTELQNAIAKLASKCKLLVIAPRIGDRSLVDHISCLKDPVGSKDALMRPQNILLLDSDPQLQLMTYESAVHSGEYPPPERLMLIRSIEANVSSTSPVNVQFTSGTTGAPKAAMLSHRNIINNGAFVGGRMHLTEHDIICCSPPLFHCFGLVMGFLASYYHGSLLVFPSDVFDAPSTLQSIEEEHCTAVYGVPTMFLADLELAKHRSNHSNKTTIRTGIAAGTTVPPMLLQRLRDELNWKGILIAYGMTETSPVSFMMNLDDPPHRLEKGLGLVMPHTQAKIVDKDGNVVPRKTQGELWTAGYNIMSGYFENKKATEEVLVADSDNPEITWMRTGDECIMDDEGYCEITGRTKDIIIRGGENIFPAEIEEVLLQHELIAEASVVGIADHKYGEVVGCFLKVVAGRDSRLPKDEDIQQYVRSKLGRHKAPRWIFWIGQPGVGEDFPKTGSGKHRKHVLKEVGERLLRGGQHRLQAKL